MAYCDSLEKVGEMQNKPSLIAEAYYIRGKMSSEKFEIKESNEWFFKALEIHKKLGPSFELGKVYGYLANNARITHNKSDFDYFLNLAEKVYQQVGSIEGMEDVRIKKTNILSGAFGYTPDYKKAVKTYQEMLSTVIPKNKFDSLKVATLNFLIAKNLLSLNDISALDHLAIVEDIYENTKNDQLIICYLTQVDAYLAFKKYDEIEHKIEQIHASKAVWDMEKRVHYHQTMAAYYSYKKDNVKYLQNALATEQIQNTMNQKSQVDFSEFYTNAEILKEQRSMITRGGVYMSLGIMLIVALAFFVIWFGKNYQIKARQEYKSSLLVQEVNHRIKNNFQTLSNLLMLQEIELSDPTSRKAIEDTQQRINSLAIVHSHLYGKELLESVDMEDFLMELILQLLKVHGLEQTNFNLHVNAPPLIADKAILIGLIVNEWVTNICKYTFKPTALNRLAVTFIHKNDEWKLQVDDFGKTKIEGNKNSSFGMNLIQKLVGQLEGDLKFNENQKLSEISFRTY